MSNAAARNAGLLRVADSVYCATPTRSHVVIVQAEGDRWSAWAGAYHESHEQGSKPRREWMLYTGPQAQQAFNAAVRFAGRLTRR